MKLSVIGILALILGLASAQAKKFSPKEVAFLNLTTCGSVLYSGESYAYSGSGAYLRGISWPRERTEGYVERVEIGNPANRLKFSTNDGVVDIAESQNRLLVLTYTELEVRDLDTTKLITTIPLQNDESALEYHEHSTGMVVDRHGDVYIARGLRTIAKVNLAKRGIPEEYRFFPEQGRHKSYISDIALAGDQLIASYKAHTLPVNRGAQRAFSGLMRWDLSTLMPSAEKSLQPGISAIHVGSRGQELVVERNHQQQHLEFRELEANYQLRPISGRGAYHIFNGKSFILDFESKKMASCIYPGTESGASSYRGVHILP